MPFLPINLWLHIYVYFSYKQKSPSRSETSLSQWAARTVLHPSRFLFCFFPGTACLNFSQKVWCPVSQFPGQVRHIMTHSQQANKIHTSVCRVGPPLASPVSLQWVGRPKTLFQASSSSSGFCFTPVHCLFMNSYFCPPAGEHHFFLYLFFIHFWVHCRNQTCSLGGEPFVTFPSPFWKLNTSSFCDRSALQLFQIPADIHAFPSLFVFFLPEILLQHPGRWT